jgi:hypothetical protein
VSLFDSCIEASLYFTRRSKVSVKSKEVPLMQVEKYNLISGAYSFEDRHLIVFKSLPIFYLRALLSFEGL